MTDNVEVLLRRPSVQHASGQSRSTLYLRISEGLWTRPVNIGPRAVGWPANEVAALIATRIAGRSADEIRALVSQLHTARAACEGRLDTAKAMAREHGDVGA